MNVAPIYAGMYRIKISLWVCQWNGGKPEPCAAPQAAVLRPHGEGRQQEGRRLLTVPDLARVALISETQLPPAAGFSTEAR